MITLETVVRLDGIRGMDVFDFFITCDDARYQEWWPGTHLQFHTVRRKPGNVGSIVFMDEYIGKERLRMHAVVMKADPGKALVVQLTFLIRLPFLVHIITEDGDGFVTLRHRIEAGFRGAGRILDPLLRAVFVKSHAAAIDEHARTEFPKLRDMLFRKNSGRGEASRGINPAGR